MICRLPHTSDQNLKCHLLLIWNTPVETVRAQRTCRPCQPGQDSIAWSHLLLSSLHRRGCPPELPAPESRRLATTTPISHLQAQHSRCQFSAQGNSAFSTTGPPDPTFQGNAKTNSLQTDPSAKTRSKWMKSAEVETSLWAQKCVLEPSVPFVNIFFINFWTHTLQCSGDAPDTLFINHSQQFLVDHTKPGMKLRAPESKITFSEVLLIAGAKSWTVVWFGRSSPESHIGKANAHKPHFQDPFSWNWENGTVPRVTHSNAWEEGGAEFEICRTGIQPMWHQAHAKQVP